MAGLVRKVTGQDYAKGANEAKAQARKVGAKIGKASDRAKTASEREFAPVDTVLGGALDRFGDSSIGNMSIRAGGARNPLNRIKRPGGG